MASWNDEHICNKLICKPTLWQQVVSEPPDSTLVSRSHAPWEQPCWLYRLWLAITLSCWRAKVSATMRVTHKMNACHQPPIVKTKKMKTKRKPFVFSIQFVWWQNKQWVLLWSKCSKVGEQSPPSALITAYILFPRSGSTQRGAQSSAAGSLPQAGSFLKTLGRIRCIKRRHVSSRLVQALMTLPDLASSAPVAGQFWALYTETRHRAPSSDGCTATLGSC